MITFCGYAVKKNGKYLGFHPKGTVKQFYKQPRYPVVYGLESAQVADNGHLGEVVKVKLTMEEVK